MRQGRYKKQTLEVKFCDGVWQGNMREKKIKATVINVAAGRENRGREEGEAGKKTRREKKIQRESVKEEGGEWRGGERKGEEERGGAGKHCQGGNTARNGEGHDLFFIYFVLP